MVYQSPPLSIMLVDFLQAAMEYFINLSTNEKITIISVLLCIIGAFNILITMPIVFNFFIIPEIERKTGKKLEYLPYYDCFLFGNFSYRFSEICIYIVIKYIALKVLNITKPIMTKSRLALAKINYDVRTASKFEIAMSFFSVTTMIMEVIAATIFWQMHVVGKNHNDKPASAKTNSTYFVNSNPDKENSTVFITKEEKLLKALQNDNPKDPSAVTDD